MKKKNRYKVELFGTSFNIPSNSTPLKLDIDNSSKINEEISIFNEENTEDILPEEMLSLIQQQRFKNNFCYSQSDALQKFLAKNGFETFYYSGWVFTIYSKKPVHHAWLVYRDGDKQAVIDTGIDKVLDRLTLVAKIQNKMTEEQLIDNPTITLDLYHAFEKEMSTRTDSATLLTHHAGKMRTKSIYIGIRSTKEPSRALARRIINQRKKG